MTVKYLERRKQKPIFFVDIGLPGNIDPEISKISNCYLFDLNDLEQFFTLFFSENNKKNVFDYENFSTENIKVLSNFFKKLSFNEDQKTIFKNYVEDFFIRNSEKNYRKVF